MRFYVVSIVDIYWGAVLLTERRLHYLFKRKMHKTRDCIERMVIVYFTDSIEKQMYNFHIIWEYFPIIVA